MLSYLTERISVWEKLKKIVAIVIQYKQMLLKIISQNTEDRTSENHMKIILYCRKQKLNLSKCVQLGIFGT